MASSLLLHTLALLLLLSMAMCVLGSSFTNSGECREEDKAELQQCRNPLYPLLNSNQVSTGASCRIIKEFIKCVKKKNKVCRDYINSKRVLETAGGLQTTYCDGKPGPVTTTTTTTRPVPTTASVNIHEDFEVCRAEFKASAGPTLSDACRSAREFLTCGQSILYEMDFSLDNFRLHAELLRNRALYWQICARQTLARVGMGVGLCPRDFTSRLTSCINVTYWQPVAPGDVKTFCKIAPLYLPCLGRLADACHHVPMLQTVADFQWNSFDLMSDECKDHVTVSESNSQSSTPSENLSSAFHSTHKYSDINHVTSPTTQREKIRPAEERTTTAATSQENRASQEPGPDKGRDEQRYSKDKTEHEDRNREQNNTTDGPEVTPGSRKGQTITTVESTTRKGQTTAKVESVTRKKQTTAKEESATRKGKTTTTVRKARRKGQTTTMVHSATMAKADPSMKYKPKVKMEPNKENKDLTKEESQSMFLNKAALGSLPASDFTEAAFPTAESTFNVKFTLAHTTVTSVETAPASQSYETAPEISFPVVDLVTGNFQTASKKSHGPRPSVTSNVVAKDSDTKLSVTSNVVAEDSDTKLSVTSTVVAEDSDTKFSVTSNVFAKDSDTKLSVTNNVAAEDSDTNSTTSSHLSSPVSAYSDTNIITTLNLSLSSAQRHTQSTSVTPSILSLSDSLTDSTILGKTENETFQVTSLVLPCTGGVVLPCTGGVVLPSTDGVGLIAEPDLGSTPAFSPLTASHAAASGESLKSQPLAVSLATSSSHSYSSTSTTLQKVADVIGKEEPTSELRPSSTAAATVVTDTATVSTLSVSPTRIEMADFKSSTENSTENSHETFDSVPKVAAAKIMFPDMQTILRSSISVSMMRQASPASSSTLVSTSSSNATHSILNPETTTEKDRTGRDEYSTNAKGRKTVAQSSPQYFLTNSTPSTSPYIADASRYKISTKKDNAKQATEVTLKKEQRTNQPGPSVHEREKTNSLKRILRIDSTLTKNTLQPLEHEWRLNQRQTANLLKGVSGVESPQVTDMSTGSETPSAQLLLPDYSSTGDVHTLPTVRVTQHVSTTNVGVIPGPSSIKSVTFVTTATHNSLLLASTSESETVSSPTHLQTTLTDIIKPNLISRTRPLTGSSESLRKSTNTVAETSPGSQTMSGPPATPESNPTNGEHLRGTGDRGALPGKTSSVRLLASSTTSRPQGSLESGDTSSTTSRPQGSLESGDMFGVNSRPENSLVIGDTSSATSRLEESLVTGDMSSASSRPQGSLVPGTGPWPKTASPAGEVRAANCPDPWIRHSKCTWGMFNTKLGIPKAECTSLQDYIGCLQGLLTACPTFQPFVALTDNLDYLLSVFRYKCPGLWVQMYRTVDPRDSADIIGTRAP